MSEKKSFIITLKEDATDPAIEKVKSFIKSIGGEISHEFSLIKGFSAKLPTTHVSSVEGDEAVATIEEDSEVHIQK
ncbi:Protease B inhibitor 2 [Komagataella phaffii CBS 7435]|uniref:Protease B inhibitor 2 n=1 Tax=Komagataella phaffii (strain ATCC 76273 / CBS 7435 / CECT 11047 / NRRL Y-11430 / Wegner 21-1) TaxID=981350 RepID=F2QY59_KOMPC|nr:hypothetical protein LJB42_001513 [Komagataella kurtzmanii]CAH2450533.1 Putative protease inhibitor [Komagataella phaffii CBS 7435]CCA40337.1 Protease B inhibitor 2 [Komagataella phaffii CBS 7435]